MFTAANGAIERRPESEMIDVHETHVQDNQELRTSADKAKAHE